MKKTTDQNGFEVPAEKQESQQMFNADAQVEQQLKRGFRFKSKPAQAPAPDTDSEPLPHDLKSAFALLKEANDACVEQEIVDGCQVALSNAEIAKRKARLKRIGTHWFALQNPPAPEVRVSPNAPNELVLRMAADIEQKINPTPKAND